MPLPLLYVYDDGRLDTTTLHAAWLAFDIPGPTWFGLAASRIAADLPLHRWERTGASLLMDEAELALDVEADGVWIRRPGSLREIGAARALLGPERFLVAHATAECPLIADEAIDAWVVDDVESPASGRRRIVRTDGRHPDPLPRRGLSASVAFDARDGASGGVR